MFYEEKIIDGILHWRIDPDDEFKAYTLKELSERYVSNQELFRNAWNKLEAAKHILGRITLLNEECKNPEYASDNMAIILIIRDIAKATQKIK